MLHAGFVCADCYERKAALFHAFSHTYLKRVMMYEEYFQYGHRFRAMHREGRERRPTERQAFACLNRRYRGILHNFLAIRSHHVDGYILFLRQESQHCLYEKTWSIGKFPVQYICLPDFVSERLLFCT